MRSFHLPLLVLLQLGTTMSGLVYAQSPADMVQPGAVWKNEAGNWSLTILDRHGELFRARFDIGGKYVREVSGPVKGDKISWLAKDTRVIRGGVGGDNLGTIKGELIHIKWRDPDGKSGEFDLKRVPATTVANPTQPPVMPLTLPAIQPLPPIQTDPNQPRIEVIRDQGPNATEWVLAPLDEPIPANIRQNLTYLREDLLDEAKSGPKADPDAYTIASEYCDKILIALEQRELARVNAGYRAAQADADIKVSNSQLDARRNYQMSWPQYQREESQRAALREQETNRADLKKETVKVEWAGRVVKMRPVLDDVYRQFRAAMR